MAFQAILFGTTDAGRVDHRQAWLWAPSVAQVFNLCQSIAAARGFQPKSTVSLLITLTARSAFVSSLVCVTVAEVRPDALQT